MEKPCITIIINLFTTSTRLISLWCLLLSSFLYGQNLIKTLDTLGRTGEFSSIAVAKDGLPIISYCDNADLKVVKCGNSKCSANNVFTIIDTTGIAGLYTSMVMGSDGLPIISYFGNNDLKVAKCGNVSCTSNNLVVTVDTGKLGLYSSMALGKDGLPVIAYYDHGRLKVVKCGNSTCSSNNLINVLDSVGVDTHFSTAIGDDGLPIISYWDGIHYDLKVVKCGNVACSFGNVFSSIDTTGDVGDANSIIIGADHLPIISYESANFASGLKIVKCGNAACSTNNSMTLLTSGEHAYYTSIAISQDGLPGISYSSPENRLKFVKCGSSDCKEGNIFTTLDTNGRVGAYPALALGLDGFFIVSYNDNSHLDLKIVKCANATCSDEITEIRVANRKNFSIPKMRSFSNKVLLSDGIVFYDLSGKRVLIRMKK